MQQSEIIAKYPKLFAHLRTKDKFECGKGWNNIIESVCEQIDSYLTAFPEYYTNHELICVVKEKFGTLRIQGSFPDVVYDYISEAENKSMNVCEYCGSPGKLQVLWGWQKTLCPDCAANR